MKVYDFLSLAGPAGIWVMEQLDLDDDVKVAFQRLLGWIDEVKAEDIPKSKLDSLQQEINAVLCELESLLPLSWNTICVHLLRHIVEIIRIHGPLRSLWM